MKRTWETSELAEHFSVLHDEWALVSNKTGATRLGFAVLLKVFQYDGRFPRFKTDVPAVVIAYLATQVDVSPDLYVAYDWHGRSIMYHRAQIREFAGFREATDADATMTTAWLTQQIAADGSDTTVLTDAVYTQFRSLKIEPPTSDQIGRIVRSASHRYEEQLCTTVIARLTPTNRAALNRLIGLDPDGKLLVLPPLPPEETPSEAETADAPAEVTWQQLTRGPGGTTLASVLTEIARLARFDTVQLPLDLCAGVPPKHLQRYRQRAAVERLSELHRHPEPIRLTLMAAFCWVRRQEIIDTLIELLISITHRIQAKAEHKADVALLTDLRRVGGKTNILFHLADVAVDNPTGVIQDVLYPVVGEQTLKDLVKEHKATGSAYRQRVQTTLRASYGHHYRRMLPGLLKALTFRSNNTLHQPVITALALIERYSSRKRSLLSARHDHSP